MSDFKKSFPKHNPMNCCTAWHLWRHGLALAIYTRAGQLTANGKTEFFARRQTLAKYFGANYEATRRAFLLLVNNGWLEHGSDETHFKYMTHDDWAFLHEGKCVVQDVNPWHGEADPFIKRLFGVAGGRFRAKPHWLLGVRKYGYTDEEIVALFRTELTTAAERKKRGNHSHTAAGQCFYRLSCFLKANSKATQNAPSLR